LSLLAVFSFLLVFSAVFSWFNIRFIKLPASIGLMLLGIVFSLIVLVSGSFSLQFHEQVKDILLQIDFSEFVLDFLLSFLLFAGALHTDINKLANSRWPILIFATFGVVISTFLVGTALFYGLPLVGIHIKYVHCLLFGALISPTDPIAVMGILKKMNLSEKLESKITGESLFNDGLAVVLFATLYQIGLNGTEEVTVENVGLVLLQEIGGGLLLGLAAGYVAYLLIRSIDHYQTEVLITVALVIGSYTLASFLHFSGPLTVVLAGLFIGNKSRTTAMSHQSLDYVNKFWEMIDEILNTALFLLMGFEVLVVDLTPRHFIIGILAAIAVVVSRYLSLSLPSFLFGLKKTFEPNTLKILTWGGLRGGISIALALSIHPAMDRDFLVALTYVVVLFSIFAQGLTIEKVINYLNRKESLR